MTLPDPSLERQASGPDNIQDRVPPTERGEDPERDAMTHALTVDSSRPLSADEKKAAEHDTPIAERVYAPASERVPKEPVPGHRDMVEHTDVATPERQAADTGAAVDAADTVEDAPHGGSIAADAPASRADEQELGAARPSATYGASASTGSSATGAYGASGSSRYASSGAAGSSNAGGGAATWSEPSYARSATPSQVSTADTPTPSPYASAQTNPGYVMPENWDVPSRPWWMPAAWVFAPACVVVAAFLYFRWRRERNKPINRIRRQAGRARKAAGDLRGRVPNTTEVAQPTMGLLAALASTGLVLWRRMQADDATSKVSKQARQARETISEADWQQRLLKLKERWTPHRLELEKMSISKH